MNSCCACRWIETGEDCGHGGSDGITSPHTHCAKHGGGLLPEDHSEIRLVPDASRAVWYTDEQRAALGLAPRKRRR